MNVVEGGSVEDLNPALNILSILNFTTIGLPFIYHLYNSNHVPFFETLPLFFVTAYKRPSIKMLHTRTSFFYSNNPTRSTFFFYEIVCVMSARVFISYLDNCIGTFRGVTCTYGQAPFLNYRRVKLFLLFQEFNLCVVF